MKRDLLLLEMSKQQSNLIVNRIRNIIDIHGDKAIQIIKKNIKFNSMDDIGRLLSSFNDKVLQRTVYELEKL